MKGTVRGLLFGSVLITVGGFVACSSDDNGDENPSSGGTTSAAGAKSGGATNKGGATGVGGSGAKGGTAGAGAVATGGAAPTTGGAAPTSGGAGGTSPATGGATPGGATSTGGVVQQAGTAGKGPTTGGTSPGGNTSTGGTNPQAGTAGKPAVTGGTGATAGASSGGTSPLAGAPGSGGTSAAGAPAAGGSSAAGAPTTGGDSGTAGAAGAGGCGTTNGTYTEATTFATTDSTDPYAMNNWSTLPDAALTQTTTNPTSSSISIDCSGGCALLHLPYPSGTAQNKGVNLQYFSSARNLLNETVSIKLAVNVMADTGTTEPMPVSISLVSFSGASDYNHSKYRSMGSLTTLAPASGFYEYTVVLQDATGPGGAVLCASEISSLAIAVGNSAAITTANSGTVDIYVQSITIGP